MIVVSDTTPLCYLAVPGQLNLLPSLFEAVSIPVSVLRECRHPRAPLALRQFAENPPVWLTVAEDGPIEAALLEELDRGEAAAIALALRLAA